MRAAEWKQDWSLHLRMLVVMISLVGLSIAFVRALLWLLADLPTWLLSEYYGTTITIGKDVGGGLLLVAGVLVLALEVTSGQQFLVPSTDETDERDTPLALQNTVVRHAQAVDLPPPTLVIQDSPVPNAYSAGISPRSAMIVLTSGLLDSLSDAEVAAVLAHEIAHIKNRDAPLMVAATAIVVASQVIAEWLRRIIESVENDAMNFVLFGMPALASLLIAGTVWVVGRGLVHLLSQSREFAADRGSVAITGSPASLASALRSIDREISAMPRTDARVAHRARTAFFIVSTEPATRDVPEELTGLGISRGSGVTRTVVDRIERAEMWIRTALPTHPPTQTRIERLKRLQDN